MRTPRPLDGDALWNYAVKALGLHAHSAGELKTKLRRRAARLADVDAVMSRLKDLGYLNDRQFAESFAAARLENQRSGRMRVLRDLRARSVAPALAEQTVQRVYAGTDEIQLIEEHLRRKLHTDARPLAGDKQIAAAFRRLVRAGFSRANVVRVLKQYARDAAALEAAEAAEENLEET